MILPHWNVKAGPCSIGAVCPLGKKIGVGGIRTGPAFGDPRRVSVIILRQQSERKMRESLPF